MVRRSQHETAGPEPVVLRDGTRMLIRRLQPDDDVRLGRLAGRLSPEALRLRFFTARKRFTQAQLRQLVALDFERNAAFAAVCPDDDEIRAVGRMAGGAAGTAEVAFIVEDVYQGQGIATELLQHLVAFARTKGYEEFTAIVLAENRDMFDVFSASRYPMVTAWSGPTVRVSLDIRRGAEKESQRAQG
ncbi:MAG: GNAT family N-acetyltransferase [Tepidiformaceae bacterium]